MRVNYFGRLDARARTIAENFEGDPKWRNGVLLYAALCDKSPDALTTPAVDDVLDSPWIRETRAYIKVLTIGPGSAAEQLRAVRAECEQPPRRLAAAAHISVLLGESEHARQIVELGLREGEISHANASYRLAEAELVTSDAAAPVKTMEAYLRERSVPLTTFAPRPTSIFPVWRKCAAARRPRMRRWNIFRVSRASASNSSEILRLTWLPRHLTSTPSTHAS